MSTIAPVQRLRMIGPAIIVAAVVCGPGSILTASRVGASYGYSFVWLIALLAILMTCSTALAARIGVSLEATPCREVSNRIGFGWGLAVGLIVFLITAGFQTSNNIAVLTAIGSLLPEGAANGSRLDLPLLMVAALNLGLIAVVYKSRELYRPVELCMKAFVLIMVIAFLVNAVFARPSLTAALAGLVPRIQGGMSDTAFLAVAGLTGTTFSITGAMYQAYLVRDRGWGMEHLRRGWIDSVVGITVLAFITLVIMLTAAATFFGTPAADELNTLGDVSAQLQPLFGPAAVVLFTVGIFAGALSSFLVNSMIGGQFLADGIGRGDSMDSAWARHGTVIALLTGFAGTLVGRLTPFDPVTLIIMAQSATVLGLPALALTLIFLASRRRADGKRVAPMWLLLVASTAIPITLALAIRTGLNLYARFTGGA